jgi:hypothetical protein
MKVPSPIDYDPAAIKTSVSLAGIIMALGIDLSLEMNGDFTGLCPFHDDHEPSFSVYMNEKGEQKWACHPCQTYGDVFDFIQQLQHCDFAEAKRVVLELRDSGVLPDAPLSVTKRRADPKVLERLLNRAKGLVGVLPELVEDRGINVPFAWIRGEWNCTDDGAYVYIPHYDKDGELVGLKRRWHLDWSPIAEAGSDLSNLYGTWRDRGRTDVVLCEGESDTWLVSYLLRDSPIEVLGLPHGVCAPTSEWITALTGRTVTILFDADEAGRKAVESWCLQAGPVLALKVAILPDGTDCNTAGTENVRVAIAEARVWNDISNLPIGIAGDKYVHTNNANPPIITPVSDFIFDIKRLVVMDDNMMFEVEVPGKAERQYLTGDDLCGVSRMRQWTTKRLLSWKGTDRNLTDLLELLKAQSMIVPQVKGVDVVGLHSGVFVLPDKCLGSSGWGYVAPNTDIHLKEFLHIEDEPWDLNILKNLALLHDPQTITPVLGWIAAAPFRSLYEQFPILSVTGGSGWGKTTILHTILKSFGFWVKSPPTLTGSTAHAILSYACSTNALPIWFDEFRPGARLEARMALEQVVRDAYDGSSTIKGGLYEDRMKIKTMPACAPLIVSGEDAFSETSHVERMVMVSMPKEGKNVKAWMDCSTAKVGGLGYAYLTWCLKQIRYNSLIQLPHLPDRGEHSLAVAEWGYGLLSTFCEEVCGYELTPPFDGSLCRQMQKATKDRPVILEAIDLTRGLEDQYGKYITWIDGDGTGYVKPQSLVKWAAAHSDIRLPGGSKAIQRWLEQMYNAKSTQHVVHGRCLVIQGLREILERADVDNSNAG